MPIRSYPHKPEEEALRDNYDLARDLFVPKAYQDPKLESTTVPDWLKMNAKYALSLAAFAHAFEEPVEKSREWLAEACENANLFLSRKAPMNPFEYSNYVAAAIVQGNTALLHKLTAIDRKRFTHPDVIADELVYLSAELLADLAAGRATAVGPRLDKAAAALKNKKLSPTVRQEIEPLVRMESATASGNAELLGKAVKDRTTAWVKRFKRPLVANMGDSLVDLTALGILGLARRRGLTVETDSPYLPLGWLA